MILLGRTGPTPSQTLQLASRGKIYTTFDLFGCDLLCRMKLSVFRLFLSLSHHHHIKKINVVIVNILNNKYKNTTL